MKNETRLNSWTSANIRKLLCQKNINESLFCHSSDTIPLVLYNELCRIMNTDSMIDNVQFIEVRFHAQISNGVEILWSLIHEVRHYRKCPDKMRCKQFPRYLWNVETMPRNLRLSRYFKLLNVKDCPVKLLSYAYIQWVWCSPRCKQSNVGQLSRDRLVQGCFYLAHNTITMLFLPAGVSKDTPSPSAPIYCKIKKL